MIWGTMAVAAAGVIRSERAEQASNALFQRGCALVIDMLVFGAVSLVMNSVYGVTQITSGFLLSGSSGFASYTTNTAVPWYVFTLVGLLYFTVPEALFGATPGKFLQGLRVVTVDGSPLSLGSVITRNVLRVVDYLPVLYLLGGLSVLLTANSQRLGDRLAGTTVVRHEHAMQPGVTRSASLKAKRIAGIALVALFLFTLAFDYFGRPPLEIQGLYNTGSLRPIGNAGYTLGSPQWSWGRVTYPLTGLQDKTGYPCNGSISFEWSALGWHEAGAGFVCHP
jgi:uncharacterized RDD family membrane protein YckC